MKLPIIKDKILLPKNADIKKWAVVAVDQYTSNIEYWKNLSEFVGESDSALRLIFPECYLGADNSLLINDIEKNMQDYLGRDIFYEVDGMTLTKRTTASGTRTGLVFAIDLEEYTFGGKKSLIRATEGTILNRIPPRVEIRKKCSLEFPHIMVLFNDPANVILNSVNVGDRLYNSDLNANGGHIEGFKVNNMDKILDGFSALAAKSEKEFGSPILFAVGDGNHSLATAKACWEEEKLKSNPNTLARYCLVEAVNIFDDALQFHAIHRVVKSSFNRELALSFLGQNNFSSAIKCYFAGETFDFGAPSGAIEAVAFVQNKIDEFVKTYGGEVDYIHGDEELERLSKLDDILAIRLPDMKKEELFPYIINSGVLPRKTFSMGEAEEKRYYLEGRRIK